MLVTGGWDGVSRGLDSTEILHSNDAGFYLFVVNFGVEIIPEWKMCSLKAGDSLLGRFLWSSGG